MSRIHFYVAYARTDINEPFRFELEEVEIKKVHENGMIELELPYFYCADNSSRCFGGSFGSPIDKELKLRHGTIYYSTDKSKCVEFLLDKMKEQNELANKIRERMRDSKLEIKFLEEKNGNKRNK